MAVLRVTQGPEPGAEYPVFHTHEPTVIGRDEVVEVSLQDPRASRRHAAIALEHGAWVIEDLGSSNGTALAGKRVSKALLQDGMAIEIGSHVFDFYADALLQPPARQLYGTQPVEALREEAGVFVCRGYQYAMDRDVRADWLHPKRRPAPEAVSRLRRALAAARALPAGRLVPLLSGGAGGAGGDSAESASRQDDAPGSEREEVYTVLAAVHQRSLETELNEILALGVAGRMALFRQLVELILERSSSPELCYCVGPANVAVAVRAGDRFELAVPAFDLGPFLAGQTASACHSRQLAPYLAPEWQNGPPGDPRAAAIYNLGAIGYLLLTGHAPLGEGDLRTILANHRSLPPAPASLLEKELPLPLGSILDRMLAKRPEERPRPDEILEVVRGATPTTPVADSAARPSTSDTGILREVAADEDVLAVERSAAPGGFARRRTRLRSMRRTRARKPSGLRYLPLWLLVWIGLFLAARHLSRWALREF